MKIAKVAALWCILSASQAAWGAFYSAEPGPGANGIRVDRSDPIPRVGFRLNRVLSEYRAHTASRTDAAFQSSDPAVRTSEGSVLIEARASQSGEVLLDDLRELGMRNGNRHRRMVSGLLPIRVIQQAAALDSLRSIRAVLPPIRNVGMVTSQGDVALRADIARTVHGVDGSGVSVGVMSDSYDTLGGAAADVASGDLPPGLTVVNGESGACGLFVFCIDEGRAMLQIVHDIAPGANLLFHTALISSVDFANGIAALEAAGADVIVDDLLYLAVSQ